MSPAETLRKNSLIREDERRRNQRVSVTLLGRFMLEDREEYPCQTQDMSPGSVALVTSVTGRIGERVVVYLDHIGRIEGKIVRIYQGGFAMTINATPRKKDKIAAQLTWLANRHELGLAEDREYDRSATPAVSACTLTMPDGSKTRVRVIDVSLSGAALGSVDKPAIGSMVIVGTIRSTVVRHFEEGIGVEFAQLQSPASLQENLA